MPVLFQLAHVLERQLHSSRIAVTHVPINLKEPKSSPTSIVCIEKVPNLLRTVALFQSHSLGQNLVVCTHSWLLSNFRDEVTKLTASIKCDPVSVINVDEATHLVERKRI